MSGRERLAPWAWGAVVAVLFCAGYVFSWGLRSVYQSHYPELVRQWKADGPFTLLGLYGTELGAEELAYAAKTREAASYFPPYDAFILENKKWRGAMTDAASYIAMGLVQRLTGDIVVTWLVLRLLCCLLWFVMVERIARRLTRGDEAASRFAAAFVVCFSYVLTFLWLPYVRLTGGHFLSLLAKDAWAVLSDGRTESIYRLSRPGVVYSFLFAACLADVRAAERREWRWGLLAGVCGGVLAYVHFDVWCAHLPAIFLLAALSWVRPGLSRRNLAVAAALTAILSAPYFLINYPPNPELLARAAIVIERSFAPQSLVYLALGAAILAVADGAMELWIGCLTLAVGLVRLSPLVTGKDFQFEHLGYFANIFLFLLAAGRLARRKALRARAWDAAAAACVAAAFLQGVGYAAIHYPLQGLRRDDADALSWLRANAPSESVVVALDPEINLLVPAFTDDKVVAGFSPPLYTDYPLLDLTRRLRLSLSLLGADHDKFFADVMRYNDLDRRLVDTRGVPPQAYLRKIYFFVLPEQTVRATWERAKDLAAPPFKRDFVWIGPMERRYVDPRFPRGSRLKLRPVYANATVSLYRIEGETGGLTAHTSTESRVSR